jgi:hypothetical protein
MNNKRAIEFGLLYATLASTVLFATFTFATEHAGLQSPGYFGILLLIGLGYSAVASMVFGLPIFLGLRRLGVLSGWWALVAGVGGGITMAAVTEWPDGSSYDLLHLNWARHSIVRALAFGSIGAISGLVFWRTYTRRNPRSMR